MDAHDVRPAAEIAPLGYRGAIVFTHPPDAEHLLRPVKVKGAEGSPPDGTTSAAHD